MTQHQDKKDGDCALYVPCSQVQLARVVVRVLVLVDVICVMIVVLVAHVDVVHAVDTVFVAIFCSWRCTLYMEGLRNGLSQNGFLHTSSYLQKTCRIWRCLVSTPKTDVVQCWNVFILEERNSTPHPRSTGVCQML